MIENQTLHELSVFIRVNDMSESELSELLYRVINIGMDHIRKESEPPMKMEGAFAVFKTGRTTELKPVSQTQTGTTFIHAEHISMMEGGHYVKRTTECGLPITENILSSKNDRCQTGLVPTNKSAPPYLRYESACSTYPGLRPGTSPALRWHASFTSTNCETSSATISSDGTGELKTVMRNPPGVGDR